MTKSVVVWPDATIASAMSLATSRSVRPGRSHSPIERCTRSIAAPARRSASTSAGLLRIRSTERTSPASPACAPGSAAWKASSFSAHMWLSTANMRTRGGSRMGDQRVGVVGLAEAGDVDAEVPCRGGLGGGALQRGHHEEGVALGRDDQAGQAFQGQGPVAGEVAQVGAGADQEGIEARVLGGAAGEFEAVGRIKVGFAHAPTLNVPAPPRATRPTGARGTARPATTRLQRASAPAPPRRNRYGRMPDQRPVTS